MNELENFKENLCDMEKELRRLSDNSIRVEAALNQVIKTLDKIDDKYATKDELKLLKTELAPTKKIVLGVSGLILVAVATAWIKLVIF